MQTLCASIPACFFQFDTHRHISRMHTLLAASSDAWTGPPRAALKATTAHVCGFHNLQSSSVCAVLGMHIMSHDRHGFISYEDECTLHTALVPLSTNPEDNRLWKRQCSSVTRCSNHHERLQGVCPSGDNLQRRRRSECSQGGRESEAQADRHRRRRDAGWLRHLRTSPSCAMCHLLWCSATGGSQPHRPQICLFDRGSRLTTPLCNRPSICDGDANTVRPPCRVPQISPSIPASFPHMPCCPPVASIFRWLTPQLLLYAPFFKHAVNVSQADTECITELFCKPCCSGYIAVATRAILSSIHLDGFHHRSCA